MRKEIITYTDFDDVERTETFLFHLSEAELYELQMETVGGFTQMVDRITETKDIPEIVKIFKKLLIASYGIKSPDGKRFIKNDQLREEFMQTEAYSQLYMKLATDLQAASDFINDVVPKKLSNPPMSVAPAAT